ncbi:MAG TPA: UDP-N-acetylenolpyruvoylglucosamine reductase, partial [Ignavibacteria bacterium]|nr:UDP-N-acetylenolpyruvoylglucosamine reductase [Ignavibacteria bacterium]
GFQRGYRKGNVGISENHSLALVNYGGTTAELIELAEEILERVDDQLRVELFYEPVVVNY